MIMRLTEKLCIDEIKEVVFQFSSDKALGLDEFSLRFYQIFWDTIKEDFLNLFQELYEGKVSTTP